MQEAQKVASDHSDYTNIVIVDHESKLTRLVGGDADISRAHNIETDKETRTLPKVWAHYNTKAAADEAIRSASRPVGRRAPTS